LDKILDVVGNSDVLGKGKVAPVLNKVPCMKTHPMLSQTPYCEDIWGNGSIAPCVLNFGTRWR